MRNTAIDVAMTTKGLDPELFSGIEFCLPIAPACAASHYSLSIDIKEKTKEKYTLSFHLHKNARSSPNRQSEWASNKLGDPLRGKRADDDVRIFTHSRVVEHKLPTLIDHGSERPCTRQQKAPLRTVRRPQKTPMTSVLLWSVFHKRFGI